MLVSPNDQLESRCPGPGCFNTVKQTGVGRKRVYCSDQCGTRYRRHTRTPAADNHAFAVASLNDLRHLLDQLDVVDGEDPVHSLELVLACEMVWKDLKTAVVLQSRDNKMKMPAIADALHMSTSALGRMLDSAPGRRERRLAPRLPARPTALPSPRHPMPGPPRGRNPEGGTGDTDGAAPGHGPVATFASALSHLHRKSGKTNKRLGNDVGVDPSYISRVISGERIPSWKVTRKLAHALAADDKELRPLWNAARGYNVADRATFHAALRGLHLAAAHPTIDALQSKTSLPPNQITAVLTGSVLPDWETAECLVSALNGQSDLIRPLWDIARAANPLGNTPPSTPSLCSIPVGTFG
ncbi:multiprotein-bridging factor 1 family protein [Streptomyces sp. NPDC102437]|uniref:helix-turn-helix domain-containing protein n=1 Tax=Streptomyces sp. NPDC102437 TaxID=3366175 RepID=UPI0037F126E4